VTEGNAVAFDNVELLGGSNLVLRCRIEDRIVGIPPFRLLPGSEIVRAGDRGKVVLPKDLAARLGLVPHDGPPVRRWLNHGGRNHSDQVRGRGAHR